jgi:hypothetical protein
MEVAIEMPFVNRRESFLDKPCLNELEGDVD